MLRVVVLAAVCAILLASFPSALAQSQSASTAKPIPSTFFGVSVLYLQSNTQWPLKVPVGTLGKTEGTEWNDIEPSNGTYDWTGLDDAIALGRSAGITSFVYTFWSTPTWASSNASQSCILTSIENYTGCAAPPAHIGDWDAFVKAVVSRYKGVIQYYELWNEANLAETFSGNVSEMVTMAQHAYDDIKQIDPSAIVIAPSVSRVGIAPYSPGCISSECWLAQYLLAGGGRYADAIAFHPYACFDNDSACAQLGIACPQNAIETCAGMPIETEVSSIHSIMATYNVSKPLMVTEGGFPGDIISENLLGTAEQQAAYVSRWYIVQASENVSMAVWFTEFAPQDGLAGFGEPSADTATNQAYAQTYKWLVGSVMDDPCALASGIWTCNLVLSSGTAAQIVFTDSSGSPIPYTPAAQFTAYQDLNGTVYPVDGSMSIGIEPLLLTTEPITGATSSSTTANSSTGSSETTARTTASPISSTSSSAASSSTHASSTSLPAYYLLLIATDGTIILSAFFLRKLTGQSRRSLDASHFV